MISTRSLMLSALMLIPAAAAVADTAPAPATPPPPPPEGVWLGTGALGYVQTSGNTSNAALNAALNMAYYDAPWKHSFTLGGIYAKSGNTSTPTATTAENWGARWESDYKFTPVLFGFGALRYQHDDFGSSLYQETATAGVGYTFIDTKETKLSGTVGVGYRRLDPTNITPVNGVDVRTYGPVKSGAIGTLGVNYAQVLTPTTTFTNVFLMESGSGDTMITDKLGLAVKMSDKLSVLLGYGITDNTGATSPVKKVDTIATVSLGYSF